MSITIRDRYGYQLFTTEDAATMRGVVMLALKYGINLSRADLSRANLSRADLSDADLSDADLSDANLSDADLSRANLSRANLSRANLSRADLSRADLSDANLSRANLSLANLSRANLSRANLSRANLSRANLSRANLSDAKRDLLAVLGTVPHEVAGLRQALIEGRINGQTYQGECACLVGTVANIRHVHYDSMPDLRPNSDRPAERLFLAILKGDTPETNPIAAIVLGWIDEWIAAQSVVV